MTSFLPPNVAVIQCRSLLHLFTKIRNKDTSNADFAQVSKRLMHILSEEALAMLSPAPLTVITPTGASFVGEVVDTSNIVAVSIIRAGDSLLESFMACVPDAQVGKILIQRDEETAEAKLFYSKLPSLTGKRVVLLDPMLATGGSAKCAVQVLLDAGADIKQMTFVTVLSCPEGLTNMSSAYPDIQIITGVVDEGLNEKKYIIPGLGDYGDRFFGTTA